MACLAFSRTFKSNREGYKKDSIIKNPIQFSIPTLKWENYKNVREKNKILDFSAMIPGEASTYIYSNEKDYINGYGDCFYALTTKKGGWNCLRHYEILLAGTIPYFLDIKLI